MPSAISILAGHRAIPGLSGGMIEVGQHPPIGNAVAVAVEVASLRTWMPEARALSVTGTKLIWSCVLDTVDVKTRLIGMFCLSRGEDVEVGQHFLA